MNAYIYSIGDEKAFVSSLACPAKGGDPKDRSPFRPRSLSERLAALRNYIAWIPVRTWPGHWTENMIQDLADHAARELRKAGA